MRDRLRSLGYHTDLEVLRMRGARISPREGYTVIESPDNHGFYWGNFLLFPAPPTAEDVARWPALFEAELGRLEGIRHVAFGWDDPEGGRGASAGFEAAGYQLDAGIVMTAREVTLPERAHPSLEIRPLVSDADWADAVEIQATTPPSHLDPAAYARFAAAYMEGHRRLCERGELRWMGGFEAGRQIANLGITLAGAARRFQSVATHPAHQRKGACARLVYEASRRAFEEGAEVLVMVADEFEAARRVYARVGFALTERQVGVTLVPQGERR